MKEHRVSSRYAKALTTLALEQNIEAKIVEDKDHILQVLEISKELRNALDSPIVNSEKKKAILKDLFEGDIDELTMHFLLLVEEKNRENIIADIFAEFTESYNKRHNILPVTVYSAGVLSDDIKSKTIARIEKITGMKALPDYKIDPEIIGGIQIRYKDLIFDASVKSRLDKLGKALRAA